MKALVTWV